MDMTHIPGCNKNMVSIYWIRFYFNSMFILEAKFYNVVLRLLDAKPMFIYHGVLPIYKVGKLLSYMTDCLVQTDYTWYSAVLK